MPEQAGFLGLVVYLFYESGIGLELALKTEYVGFYIEMQSCLQSRLGG